METHTLPAPVKVVPGPLPDPTGLRINLGCGPVQPAGWVNVDGSNRARLAAGLPLVDRLLTRVRLLPRTEFGPGTLCANLLRRFPWRDGSAAAVYLGEVLEHFTREQGEHVLRECRRVLRPGGVLRTRVPDNARFWANYLAEYTAARRKPRAEWDLMHTRWIEMFFRDICVRPRWFRSIGHYHKWMYDEVSLVRTLEMVGFRDVCRMPFHESRIEGVADVEMRDDLIVEAVRP